MTWMSKQLTNDLHESLADEWLTIDLDESVANKNDSDESAAWERERERIQESMDPLVPGWLSLYAKPPVALIYECPALAVWGVVVVCIWYAWPGLWLVDMLVDMFHLGPPGAFLVIL